MYSFQVLTSGLLLSSLLGGAAAAATPRKFTGVDDPSRFHYYTTPTLGSGPCDMDTGPDGTSIWYQDLLANRIGVVYPLKDKIIDFPLPYTTPPTGSAPGVNNVTALQCVVRTGKDGYVYAAAGVRNEIIQVNPNTYEMKVFSPHNVAGNLFNFNDAWGAEAGLFFSQTTGNVVTFMNYTTHKFTSYVCPTGASGPLGMRTDNNGDLWFTEFFAQQLGRLDMTTGVITEYPVQLPGGAFPEVLRTMTEGRYLWVNAFVGGGFIRVDIPTGSQKIFTYPDGGPDSFPIENDSDPLGRVWFSSLTLNSLVYYDPKDDKWTTIKLPGGIPAPTGDLTIPVHYGPLNAMWFSNVATNQVGYYLLDD